MATTMLVEDLTNDAYWRGYNAGTENEQERIIKLLESKRDTGSHDAENDFINGLLDELSALIERENK